MKGYKGKNLANFDSLNENITMEQIKETTRTYKKSSGNNSTTNGYYGTLTS